MANILTKFAYAFATRDSVTRLWDNPPDDAYFTIPDICPSNLAGAPGLTPVVAWDYSQVWMGFRWITYFMEWMSPADMAALRAGLATSDGGRVWFYYFDIENSTWQLTSGIMEEPKQSGYNGDVPQNVELTFGKVGIQA